MKAEIYADVIFAVNFFMDFFIIFSAGKLGGKKPKLWRCSIAALIAATVYCVILFNEVLFRFYNFFSAVILMIFAVFIAYMPKKIIELLKLTFYAHICAFAIGGACMALFYFTNISSTLETGLGLGFGNSIDVASHFSIKILITSVCLMYIALKLLQSRFSKAELQKQAFCTIKVFFQDTATELNALIDTGNTLEDPITKTPVVVAEYGSLKVCLPLYIRQLFDENKQDDLNYVLSYTEKTPFVGRLRLIPFQSVGQKKGVLLGFRPDKIEIRTDKAIYTKNTVIGIYSADLSCKGDYNALLNPALLESEL